MDSPISSSPTPVTVSDTTRKTDGTFELLGAKIPLPRWAIAGIGLFAVLGSGLSVYFGIVNPRLSNPAASVIPVAQTASKPTPDSTIEQANIQIREQKNHYYHTARTVKKFFDDIPQGMLEIKFFDSDRCVLIVRRNPGPNQPTSLTYVPAADTADAPPGDISSAQLGDVTVDVDWLAAQMRPASLRTTNEPAPQGNCQNPHAGVFQSANGEQRGCWLQVWRAWDDGCRHYQWYNTCNGYWDSLPDGSAKVYWTNCVH